MELKFEVYAKIRNPVSEVFDAVYNPEKLRAYFTTGGASMSMDVGAEPVWSFHDFSGSFSVKVTEMVRDERIGFTWPTDSGGETRVEMDFLPLEGGGTQVKIRESGWPESEKGLDQSYGNCMGWSQMLCCLKVYLEKGENLREFFY